MADIRQVNVRTRLADGCLALFRATDGTEVVVPITEKQFPTKALLNPAEFTLPKGKVWEFVMARKGWIFDTPNGLLGPGDFYPGDTVRDAVYISDDKRGVVLEKTEFALVGRALTLTAKASAVLKGESVKVG